MHGCYDDLSMFRNSLGNYDITQRKYLRATLNDCSKNSDVIDFGVVASNRSWKKESICQHCWKVTAHATAFALYKGWMGQYWNFESLPKLVADMEFNV